MVENSSEKGLIAKLGDAQPAPPWGIGEMLMAIAALLLGVLVIGTGITSMISSDLNNPTPSSLVMGWLIGSLIAAAFVLIRWRSTPERFSALHLQEGLWNPFLAFMVGIAGAFTASVIVGLASGDFIAPMQVFGIDADNLGALVTVITFALLAQPVAESLVFDAVILPRLRASLGGWLGLLSTVLLYVIFYYMVYGSRASGSTAIWYGVVYPLIIGFTLAAVRIWSQSTRATILAQIGVGLSVIITLLVM